MEGGKIAEPHNSFSRLGNGLKIHAGQQTGDAVTTASSHDYVDFWITDEGIEVIQAIEIGSCKIFPSVLGVRCWYDPVATFGEIQNGNFQRTRFSDETGRGTDADGRTGLQSARETIVHGMSAMLGVYHSQRSHIDNAPDSDSGCEDMRRCIDSQKNGSDRYIVADDTHQII